MKKIVLMFLTVVLSFAESKFSDPQPSFDHPRKVVMRLNFSDIERVNHTLGAIYNILKEYPDGGLNVAVVAYASGMRALKKDYDKNTLARIKSLMEYDVEFIGCKNTMETMKWKENDFIDGIDYVQAGIVEAIEREVAGWVGVTPY